MPAPAFEPLVSIVIPTWNRLGYLREAVASVLRQTYPTWELIVVDDGSTDGTSDWLRSVGDARVRSVQVAHSGNLARVRNRGNAEARGDLVAFLDSDDLFEPRKLAAQVAALEASPDCGWSYTAVTRIDQNGAAIVAPLARSFRAISGSILEDVLRFDAPVDTPTVMVRRALLNRVGQFDEGLAECQDYDLFFKIAAVSTVVALSEPLTRKRLHAGGLSGDRTRINEAWIVVYERFGAGSSDPRVRRTCAREAWKARLRAASSRVRGRGDAAGALPHVLTALARRPWSLRAWRVLLADVVLRGLLGPLRRRSARADPLGPTADGAPPPPPPDGGRS